MGRIVLNAPIDSWRSAAGTLRWVKMSETLCGSAHAQRCDPVAIGPRAQVRRPAERFHRPTQRLCVAGSSIGRTASAGDACAMSRSPAGVAQPSSVASSGAGRPSAGETTGPFNVARGGRPSAVAFSDDCNVNPSIVSCPLRCRAAANSTKAGTVAWTAKPKVMAPDARQMRAGRGPAAAWKSAGHACHRLKRRAGLRGARATPRRAAPCAPARLPAWADAVEQGNELVANAVAQKVWAGVGGVFPPGTPRGFMASRSDRFWQAQKGPAQ